MPNDPTPDLIRRIHPRIRARFPLLDHDGAGRRRIYLNSGAGSLTVDTAAEAAARAVADLNPMPGVVTPGEVETARLHDEARAIAAEFLNARSPREISFHVSTTAALFNLAFALRADIGRGDNLVVTDLDHMANVTPWEVVLGEGAGAEVRRAPITSDGTLDPGRLLDLIDARTRVLAMTMASNGLGTVPPLAALAAEARKRCPDCLIVIDAVHHALHGPIDVRAVDCDFLAFSGYKVFGPMLGVLWGRQELLEKLRPYRVETNKNEPPWKFEQGMLNNAALASLAAALDYLLWLAGEAGAPVTASRRQRFVFALEAVAAYERGLSRRVLEGFRALDPGRFTGFGILDPGRAAERDPTFAFEVAGQTALETKTLLWQRHGIQIADGNHYSAAVFRHLRKAALCRASFAHYDTEATAEAFLAALGEVAGKRT